MNNPKTRTSARSSAEYSAELVPDPLLQRLSTGLSTACLLAGIALIVSVGLPSSVTLIAVTGWSIWLLHGLRQVPIRRLRLYANGDVHLQHSNGHWFDGRVAAGSLFLSRIVWLRVDGRVPYRGWFIARDDATAEWRRLRVIARHFADI